ncbi:MAG: thiol reductase thioredoxin [Caulobacterales bacterium]|nr:thiol reductase thioredoxin [Caulobacterales bacterium]
MTPRQFVCPSCGATNRSPAERDALKAKCGRCGEPLFTGHPADVSGEALKVHRRATQGAAVLVDVWAPWCGPCRTMGPQFAAAAAALEPTVRLLKLNADEEGATTAELGVSGIPALILFRDGQIVARQAGAMTANQIVAWTTQALARPTA